ncbi:hypothetical protein PAHAL_2G467000 [Panicum hallii]|uniref:Uncharacterized protein n=1 Tax=Panicum hallii TaxID=206008 RepID=A0A2T8KT51_9POAL|nr:hypothetical protein PAHAL_2G467000 [Panicum hallii]
MTKSPAVISQHIRLQITESHSHEHTIVRPSSDQPAASRRCRRLGRRGEPPRRQPPPRALASRRKTRRRDPHRSTDVRCFFCTSHSFRSTRRRKQRRPRARRGAKSLTSRQTRFPEVPSQVARPTAPSHLLGGSSCTYIYLTRLTRKQSLSKEIEQSRTRQTGREERNGGQRPRSRSRSSRRHRRGQAPDAAAAAALGADPAGGAHGGDRRRGAQRRHGQPLPLRRHRPPPERAPEPAPGQVRGPLLRRDHGRVPGHLGARLRARRRRPPAPRRRLLPRRRVRALLPGHRALQRRVPPPQRGDRRRRRVRQLSPRARAPVARGLRRRRRRAPFRRRQRRPGARRRGPRRPRQLLPGRGERGRQHRAPRRQPLGGAVAGVGEARPGSRHLPRAALLRRRGAHRVGAEAGGRGARGEPQALRLLVDGVPARGRHPRPPGGARHRRERRPGGGVPARHGGGRRVRPTAGLAAPVRRRAAAQGEGGAGGGVPGHVPRLLRLPGAPRGHHGAAGHEGLRRQPQGHAQARRRVMNSTLCWLIHCHN